MKWELIGTIHNLFGSASPWYTIDVTKKRFMQKEFEIELLYKSRDICFYI